MRPVRWKSPPGFKCQTLSTSTSLSVFAQCQGGARFIVWSCGDGAKVNELALELAPESEVVPAIAWPNWFATCAMAATKVSDALREFLSVAVTLMASAFVPSGMSPLKVSVAPSKLSQDGSGAPFDSVAV